MKGRAHLEWLQLLQLNKCGWMIISFPPRSKRKRRQRRIITPSKTIKSDFEVVAPPNLGNTSAAETAFRASAERRRRTAASWATGSGPLIVVPLLPGCRGHRRASPPTERRRGAAESTARQESSEDPIPASKAAGRGSDVGLVLAHNLEQLLQPGDGSHPQPPFCPTFGESSYPCAHVCCVPGRPSISQLKSCSQDSFPAGLRSSVVPLHPADLRSAHACQTEYTLIAPDWEQQIFLELLDITGANKHCEAILLSSINRKC